MCRYRGLVADQHAIEFGNTKWDMKVPSVITRLQDESDPMYHGRSMHLAALRYDGQQQQLLPYLILVIRISHTIVVDGRLTLASPFVKNGSRNIQSANYHMEIACNKILVWSFHSSGKSAFKFPCLFT
jgi:hypothetical protein